MSNLNLEQIKQFLDLEKIYVIQTIKIMCFPNEMDSSFNERFNRVKEELKTISPSIDLVIVKEGEIIDERPIELCWTGSIDEPVGHGE